MFFSYFLLFYAYSSTIVFLTPYAYIIYFYIHYFYQPFSPSHITHKIRFWDEDTTLTFNIISQYEPYNINILMNID